MLAIRLHRRVALFVTLALPWAAAAQDFPTKPIRIVVPFAADGGVDILTRTLAKHLADRLGQQVIVDNRAGVGGTLSTDAVAKAPTDGYTLVIATTGTHTISPSLYPKLPFVEALFSEEIMLVISPSLKAKLHICTSEDQVTQDLIFSELTLVQWPHWFSAHGVPVSPSSYSLALDRTSITLDADTQGLGIALDSDRTAEAALRRGDPVPVFDVLKSMLVRAHHLVYPRAYPQWDRVVNFTHWLREEAAKE